MYVQHRWYATSDQWNNSLESLSLIVAVGVAAGLVLFAGVMACGMHMSIRAEADYYQALAKAGTASGLTECVAVLNSDGYASMLKASLTGEATTRQSVHASVEGLSDAEAVRQVLRRLKGERGAPSASETSMRRL